MITPNGYSKDPSLRPDGIVITFGEEMLKNNGGPLPVLRYFLQTMETDDRYWMHKMKNRPTVEIADIYIVTLGRLWGRVKFGWYENGATFAYRPDGSDVEIAWPRMVLIGPFEPCPFKRKLKGFQGFRYCTKLF